ncbi:MAG: sulfatase [Cyclobacteriaceae bacterium]
MVLSAILLFGCSSQSNQLTERDAGLVSPPNVVLIFMDDLGYGDINTYGGTGSETPNLDRLASEGMRFTNFYAAQGVCSASRAGLLTGCYPNRIGVVGALMPWDDHGIGDGETTMAELLKSKGYATAIFGKWHLGHHKQFLPLQHGFNEFMGIPYSNDMWPVDFDGTPVGKDHDRSIWPVLPFFEGNKRIEDITTPAQQNMLTTRITNRAVNFINQHKDTPFFLYVPHPMPHVPLGVSEKFRGKSKQGKYGDVLMEIDWSVGKIMEALRRNGIDDNTLVIFTSDNGPWLNYGDHAGSTGGLREGKGTSWEGGQREPCIMRWPATIPAGKTCHELSSTIDLLPTLAAITEAEIPSNKIDGVNLLPLLKAVPNSEPRKEFYYYYGYALEGVRKGNWKLVFPHDHRSYEGVLPTNGGWPGPYRKGHTGLALYDLRRDPGEEYDVKDLYPDVVEQLKNIASKAREDLGDDLMSIEGKNVRPAGKI